MFGIGSVETALIVIEFANGCTRPHRYCQALCNATVSCVGWVFVGQETPAQDLCCAKRRVDRVVHSPRATAGVKPALLLNHTRSALLLERSNSRRPGSVPLKVDGPVPPPNATLIAEVPPKAGDGTGFTLRVLVDASVIEVSPRHPSCRVLTSVYRVRRCDQAKRNSPPSLFGRLIAATSKCCTPFVGFDPGLHQR